MDTFLFLLASLIHTVVAVNCMRRGEIIPSILFTAAALCFLGAPFYNVDLYEVTFP